jgi:hypothetical protein
VLARILEEAPVGLALELRHQRLQGRLHIADQTELQRRALAQRGAAPVDLHHVAMRRIEVAIREIGAEHHERVARHHRVIAGAEADQPGHADVERVVPLHVLFAAQRMHGRRAELIGEGDHFIVRAGAAAAAQQRHAARLVEQIGEPVEIRLGRHHRRAFQRAGPRRRFLRRFAQCDIARQHDHGNAAFFDRGAHGARQHARKL